MSNKKKHKVTRPFHELLSGVTISISGIENPERTNIRNNALAMGAKYQPDWNNTCTHLVCAVINTPKYYQAKGSGKVITRSWVTDCYSQRKRLPWRRYALDPKDQKQEESEDEILEALAAVLDGQSKKSHEESDSSEDAACNSGDGSATEEEILDQDVQESGSPVLGSCLSNQKIYIDKQMPDDVQVLLFRYITFCNGTIITTPTTEVNYVISLPNLDELQTHCPNANFVNPDWVWECYNTKQLAPATLFKL